MRKLYYSIYSAKIKYELVCNSIRVVIFFLMLTDLTEFSIEFCVDEVFEDRGGLDVRRRRRCKSSSLGIPRNPK